jgi:ComF family protein
VLVAARSSTALRGPAERLVRALKYDGWSRLAGELGARMARVPLPVTAPGPATLVVPVPTLPSRARRRGYNQALLLAGEVGRRKQVPVLEAVRRTGGGRSQVSLQVEERAANVESSFEPASHGAAQLDHHHVLVVDDVLTTGATVAAVARVLESCGVRAVTALTFARALPRPVDRFPM